ncbi:hypothetical protein [Botryobacter ruber]|uniref:hypothetical protein n=1 Tax=Botryobacter ruber TaxID=2171629 RepID=UPI000E0C6F34|nr:hypothetical protein [Botryobacter ruber]
MPNLRLLCLFLLLLCYLPGCNTAPDTPEQPVTDHELLTETMDSAAEEKEAATENIIPDSVALQSYAVDTTGLTPEPAAKIKILLEGVFHKEEIWQGAEKKQWLGLFDMQGSYELRPTTLDVKPAFDPVADARTAAATGQKVISGREVTGHEPNVMLFITGLPGYKAATIDTAAFAKNIIRPGEEIVLSFKNRQYHIQAFGDSMQVDSSAYAYSNYGWKVSGTRKGKRLEQVLAQDEQLAGSVYVLHWAGDIDRDGIPDLIAELSAQPNRSRTALFLSSEADRGKLYKKVAAFESSAR